jgi:hypothetical protein
MPLTIAALLATAVIAGPGAAGAGTLAMPPALLFQVGGDAAIQRAFRVVLRREPSSFELRRYRMLMQANGWTEADVRRDLRERTDYRAMGGRRGVTADDVVRRAYQDILGREPDPDGLRNYRSKIVDDGWSERDVREALRQSDEYAATGGAGVGFRTASADRIIRRAYQDILGREPDAAGLQTYRGNILQEGWDEHDVRQALIRSPERRQKQLGPSMAQAQEMVRNAYRSVLGREPDPGGMGHYTAKVIHERWTEEDMVQALRDSDEYREKRP